MTETRLTEAGWDLLRDLGKRGFVYVPLCDPQGDALIASDLADVQPGVRTWLLTITPAGRALLEGEG